MKPDKKIVKEELQKLFGKPLYDSPMNFCLNDNYYAKSLEEKYAMSLAELEKLAGVKP